MPTDFEAEIRRLVQGLNSLREGQLSAELLAGCGPAAIGPLREFLFEGRPSGIYEPRRWAVEALAKLGARDVLIDYLLWERQIPDPVVRCGETAVENAAARALAAWRDEETFRVLLHLARTRALPGVIEAVGQFQREEAVPYLVEALADDFSRAAAEDALRDLSSPARPALVQAALTRREVNERETPSSLRLRRSALRLLLDIGLEGKDWPKLRLLMQEADAEIAIAACGVALRFGPPQDRQAGLQSLVERLPRADWFLQLEIVDWLVDYFDLAAPLVEGEIARRCRLPPEEQASDPVLRVLRAVKRRTGAAARKNWQHA